MLLERCSGAQPSAVSAAELSSSQRPAGRSSLLPPLRASGHASLPGWSRTGRPPNACWTAS
eukprot:2694491-Lingulodinium_polyedra.AAC.1